MEPQFSTSSLYQSSQYDASHAPCHASLVTDLAMDEFGQWVVWGYSVLTL